MDVRNIELGDSTKSINLTRFNEENFTFRGNGKEKIIGKGTIKLKILATNDVSLIEGLNYNMISISKLRDKVLRIIFEEDKCNVSKQ